jgi:hypothetical protein
MLVMWDRGFHDFDMIARVRERQAHVLGRLPAHVKPEPVLKLSDGSYLAYLYPSDYQRRRRGEHLLVRIIEYTLTDPALPGYETHRLVTTCWMLTLAAWTWPAPSTGRLGYIDEIDSHQRLAGRPCSASNRGVIQELYGL